MSMGTPKTEELPDINNDNDANTTDARHLNRIVTVVIIIDTTTTTTTTTVTVTPTTTTLTPMTGNTMNTTIQHD